LLPKILVGYRAAVCSGCVVQPNCPDGYTRRLFRHSFQLEIY